MTTHISARIAWHMDGWNGRICKNPAANTYCSGQFSYPGQMVAERRDLGWEEQHKGQCCSKLDQIPPCIYSINAFGTQELKSFADPPDFFKDQTQTRYWKLPPATVCIWPYEEMYYTEGVTKTNGGFDYDKRLEAARNYFASITPNQSLIFYYANYSNPFSEEDQRNYVLVGLSRVKSLGEELFYNNCSEETKKKYGGGFVWQRDVTSHYPDEGFRIPYHLYMDKPDVLERILLVPENPRNCKYATRRISDDDALDLVEQFLGIAVTLKELGDTSEDWSVRIAWLQSLVAELWQSRGLYPGMTKVLDYLEFQEAIPFFKEQVLLGQEKEARDAIVAFLDGSTDSIPDLPLTKQVAQKVRRQWQVREDDEQNLLRDVLPRFDLYPDQIKRIISSERSSFGIHATPADIVDNPYLLSEGYVGDGPDDVISFNKIDHGIFPSPDLGGEFLFGTDDWRRLRGLCCDRLKTESKHTFLSASQVIFDINRRLSYFPDWKQHQFTEKYLKIDEADLSGALTFREERGQKYIYLKSVYEDERAIEQQIRFLVNGPDIIFKSPVTERHWHSFLYDPNSILVTQNAEEYEQTIQGQIEVCQKIFVRPVCVLSGGAGTGKTTVIRSLIRAIDKAHGSGTSFQLLAPTGKAADRIREKTGKPAATIHSFLAKRGWLNDNMTFKRTGGKKEDGISTYIIDEASMLDLSLAASLFRAINWASVQRLILVGDPNQLPPIGQGRVFADIIDWFVQDQPESIGVLENNIRQMENRLTDKGTGILDLASLYVRPTQTTTANESFKLQAELMLKKVQEGGEIDKDLRVLYWKDADDLAEQLTSAMVADMEQDAGQTFNPAKPWELWRAAFKGDDNQQHPEYQQVISPYRGELFGVDHLNTVLQTHSKGRQPDHHRQLGGITLFDKVIQYRNRSKSSGIWAYNTETKQSEQIEVFNGELGFVKPHGFDTDKLKWKNFVIKHFQVVFSRKPQYWVGYGSELGKTPKGWYLPTENVEDNLELAYVISVHKAQGSEFERVYFILPKNKAALLSPELFYTGITRASRHCTILVEEDISPLLSLRRPEKSHLARISSSLFFFRPIPPELQRMGDWYEEGKIHNTLADLMVRSKSEVIIVNMLHERDIPFRYEVPLFASDGTFYLPDFTITWRGQDWYWEHLGMLDQEKYRSDWEIKKAWYDKFFPGRLVITQESGNLSKDADALIQQFFS